MSESDWFIVPSVLVDPMCSTGFHNLPYDLSFLYQTCTISHTDTHTLTHLHCLSHTHIISVSTSALFHHRPRYHDTASQRTLASSKMQTGYFSACMPACFHLLLMNHLACTHSFMYTHSFLILKSREHVFLLGPYHLFPNGLKTLTHRKWNWSSVKTSLGLSSVHIFSIVSNLENSPGIISETIFVATVVLIMQLLNICRLFSIF